MNILILEPHYDDVELGCSIFLESLAPGTNIDIFTFCKGRDNLNLSERMKKRAENILYWESLGLNIKPFSFPRDLMIRDTELEWKHTNQFLSNFDFHNIDLLLIPQTDLHTDHVIVNKIGQILGRKIDSIYEYIIMNSFSTANNSNSVYPIWNTVFKTKTKESLWEVCRFPTEQATTEEKLKIQKFEHNDTNYMCDRMNLIKNNIKIGG